MKKTQKKELYFNFKHQMDRMLIFTSKIVIVAYFTQNKQFLAIIIYDWLLTKYEKIHSWSRFSTNHEIANIKRQISEKDLKLSIPIFGKKI